ncbi:unnamed protein product [Mytilus coruscus]|uniref:Ig-like domain-containing protein n=1 Tax=Mytilus coruscus TaxID=42192 RepID=A0A6J8F088_MYTCO|nr:unnamed protein product [Mytilus coruscus]
MIFATFLVWFTAQMRMTELVELHLYILTKPVIYGQDLSFICSSDVRDKTSLYSWYWFKNDRILYTGSSPGNDVDIDKYEENKVTENIRKLTIKDFEFSDIQNYKCVHAFNETSLDLDIESYNFVYLGNRSIMETMLQDNRIIVNLFEVSPVPTCSIIIKNSYLSMTEHSRFKDVYLYSISFQRILRCGYGDIITNVECDVGGLKFNKAVNISCALSDPNYKTQPYILATVVPISVIMIAAIIITSVIVHRKRELKSARDLDSDVENDPQRELFLECNTATINIQS